MIIVKNASVSDIPVIHWIAEKTWWPVYSSIIAPEQIEYMIAELYSENALRNTMEKGLQHFLILQDSSFNQGFASYGVWDEDKDVWKIHKLYILPENHGKGYGRKLIEEIVQRARKSSIKALALNVNRDNPALHFYKKLGFTIQREEDIPIGPYWMNDYVMTISL